MKPKSPLLLVALALTAAATAQGGEIFVNNDGTGAIGVYSTRGSTINPALFYVKDGSVLTGDPIGILATDTNIFVTSLTWGLQEYSIGGSLLNVPFPGNATPIFMAMSGDDLYVANYGDYETPSTVNVFTPSGTVVASPLISDGTVNTAGIAVSGTDLFVTNQYTGTISKYTTSGATVNTALVRVSHFSARRMP
jgi:hypothetical protein